MQTGRKIFHALGTGWFVTLNALAVSIAMLVVLNWWAKRKWERIGAADSAVVAGWRDVYPKLSDDEVRRVLKETWEEMHYEYAPWVTARERDFSGRYVNVSAKSGRRVDAGDTLESAGKKILFLGGSTTFGYGVPDWETIPAYFSAKLRERGPAAGWKTFNFGRGSYYSTMETALFQHLLRDGVRPDIVVFIDGLNEGKRFPYYTQELHGYFDAFNYSRSELLTSWVASLPLTRLLVRNGMRLGKQAVEQTKDLADPKNVVFQSHQSDIAKIRDEYAFNKNLISDLCRRYGIEVYFVLQPVPGFRNSFAKHPLQQGNVALNWHPFLVKKMVALQSLLHGSHDIDLTASLSDYAGIPFVDDVHYSGRANELLAKLLLKKILPAEAQAREKLSSDNSRRPAGGKGRS